MSNKFDDLIHPDTQERVTASTELTWLWVALCGPFHHLFNGRVSTFFISVILLAITGGLVAVYYFFWCRTVNRNYYKSRGYVAFSDYDRERKEQERHDRLIELVASK